MYVPMFFIILESDHLRHRLAVIVINFVTKFKITCFVRIMDYGNIQIIVW